MVSRVEVGGGKVSAIWTLGLFFRHGISVSILPSFLTFGVELRVLDKKGGMVNFVICFCEDRPVTRIKFLVNSVYDSVFNLSCTIVTYSIKKHQGIHVLYIQLEKFPIFLKEL